MLTEGDLKKLGSISRANPHKKDWSAMRLYMQSQVPDNPTISFKQQAPVRFEWVLQLHVISTNLRNAVYEADGMLAKDCRDNGADPPSVVHRDQRLCSQIQAGALNFTSKYMRDLGKCTAV